MQTSPLRSIPSSLPTTTYPPAHPPPLCRCCQAGWQRSAAARGIRCLRRELGPRFLRHASGQQGAGRGWQNALFGWMPVGRLARMCRLLGGRRGKVSRAARLPNSCSAVHAPIRTSLQPAASACWTEALCMPLRTFEEAGSWAGTGGRWVAANMCSSLFCILCMVVTLQAWSR